MLLAGSDSVHAKVSVSATLCFANKRQTIDSHTSAVLNRLLARVREIERTYGKPEAVVVATVLPDLEVEAPSDSEARASSVLKYLRDVGLASKEQGVMRTTGPSHTDIGCTTGEAAVEVEILFSHQLDAAPTERRSNRSLDPTSVGKPPSSAQLRR